MQRIASVLGVLLVLAGCKQEMTRLTCYVDGAKVEHGNLKPGQWAQGSAGTVIWGVVRYSPGVQCTAAPES